MITPGNFEIKAMRWQPLKVTVAVVGYDLSGGTFKMQVRDWPDQDGSARITLTNATAGSQGISVAVATVDGVPTSTLTIQIDETTIEGLPFPSPRGTDLELAYDLVIEATGVAKSRWLEGAFIVHGGSTQT